MPGISLTAAPCCWHLLPGSESAVLQREVTNRQKEGGTSLLQLRRRLWARLCRKPSHQPCGKEAARHFRSACADRLAGLHGFSAARAAPSSSDCLQAPRSRRLVLCDQRFRGPWGIHLRLVAAHAAEAAPSVLTLWWALRCHCPTPRT